MNRIVKTFESFTADDYNRMEQDYHDKLELADLRDELDEEADPEMARAALISLASGDDSVYDVKIRGQLSEPDYEEGWNSSDGEVEISWSVRSRAYDTIIEVNGSFYLEKGSPGRWGSSIDDSEPPEDDTASRSEITINDKTILVGDQFGNEYEFNMEDLGKKFVKDLEDFLLDGYDPIDATIS